MSANVHHSSSYDGWGTPDAYLDAIREVLGGIDFDAASTYEDNERVNARWFYGPDEDALTTPWPEAEGVYLNPPGGKIGNKSKSAMFWQRLIDQRDAFDHAIFAVFNLNLLQVTQLLDCPSLLEFPLCFPRRRVAWIGPGTQPSHASAFAYVRGHRHLGRPISREESFVKVFSKFGAVRITVPGNHLRNP